MNWVVGVLALTGVALLLRRLLSLGRRTSPRPEGLVPLRPELLTVYHPVAREVETQAVILGIALNDAFEERAAQRDEVAWSMVGLSASEWDRLAEVVTGLLQALAKYGTAALGVVPARKIAREHFKSRAMAGHLQVHELLDRVVFGSGLRYQLQVRLLRRAAEILTKEFRRTYRRIEQTEHASEEDWTLLDIYAHDFDLVTKETLLAFRALLAYLPAQRLKDLSLDLTPLVEQGRSRAVPLPTAR